MRRSSPSRRRTDTAPQALDFGIEAYWTHPAAFAALLREPTGRVDVRHARDDPDRTSKRAEKSANQPEFSSG